MTKAVLLIGFLLIFSQLPAQVFSLDGSTGNLQPISPRLEFTEPMDYLSNKISLAVLFSEIPEFANMSISITYDNEKFQADSLLQNNLFNAGFFVAGLNCPGSISIAWWDVNPITIQDTAFIIIFEKINPGCTELNWHTVHFSDQDFHPIGVQYTNDTICNETVLSLSELPENDVLTLSGRTLMILNCSFKKITCSDLLGRIILDNELASGEQTIDLPRNVAIICLEGTGRRLIRKVFLP